MAITKKKRKEIEDLIYSVFTALDKSNTNTNHYKALFDSMSDEKFEKYLKNTKFPYRFHYAPFEIEPTMSDIDKATKILGFSLSEPVALPYLYEDEKGNPIVSQPALIIDLHIKRMQQMITKKNSTPTDISKRDMKTGLLISDDKGGKTSDREMESLVLQGLDQTSVEFGRHKADYMKAKNAMYSTISTTGQFSLKDAKTEAGDSLARNMVNVYMMGAQLYTNLLNEDYYLPWTLKERRAKALER